MKKIIAALFFMISAFANAQTGTAIKVNNVSDVAKITNVANGMHIIVESYNYGGGNFTVRDSTGLKINYGTVFPLNKNFYLVRDAYINRNDVLADWFIPNYSDTADLTPYIQNAVSFCYNKTLSFSTNKKYCFLTVYLPLTITLKGNNCFVTKYLSRYNNTALFMFDPTRIKQDGTYTGGRGIAGNSNNIRTGKNIVIDGFNFDGAYTQTGLFWASCTNDFTGLTDVVVSNNTGINTSGRFIHFAGAHQITDSSGKIINARITRNKTVNSGYWLEVLADNNYNPGSSTIKVRCLDSIALSAKANIGSYIQFASMEIKALGKGGYTEGLTHNASNAVYKIIAFEADSYDKLKGTITIQSGAYDKNDGWTADITNTGLKAPIVKNAWLLPLYSADYLPATVLPTMQFNRGYNYAVQAEHSNKEDVLFKNFYTGEKFLVANGIEGIKTITVIKKDTIYFDKPANATTTTKPSLLGSLGASVSFVGDIRNAEVSYNLFEGGGHGINGSRGVNGKGLFTQDIPTSFFIHHNIIRYNWMNLEMFSGSNGSVLPSLFSFNLIKGDSSLIVTNPSQYHYYKKDMDADGVADNIFSSSSTYENASLDNSLIEGDIVSFKCEIGMYKLVKIPADYPGKPILIFRQFDPDTRKDVRGGFINTVTSVKKNGYDAICRLYSVVNGCPELYGTIKYSNNLSEYSIRAGSGYELSFGANLIEVADNIFNGCQYGPFETSGGTGIFKNNTLTYRVWNGDAKIPGKTGFGAGGIIEAGNIMLLGLNSLLFSGNKLNYIQTDTSLYGNKVAVILAAERPLVTANQKDYIIENNQISGLVSRLMGATSLKNINGTNYPSLYFENMIIRNNSFNIYPQNSVDNLGFIMAGNNIIEGNTFNFKNVPRKTWAKLFGLSNPNPEIFPTFKMQISNNKSNRSFDWGEGLSKSATITNNIFNAALK